MQTLERGPENNISADKRRSWLRANSTSSLFSGSPITYRNKAAGSAKLFQPWVSWVQRSDTVRWRYCNTQSYYSTAFSYKSRCCLQLPGSQGTRTFLVLRARTYLPFLPLGLSIHHPSSSSGVEADGPKSNRNAAVGADGRKESWESTPWTSSLGAVSGHTSEEDSPSSPPRLIQSISFSKANRMNMSQHGTSARTTTVEKSIRAQQLKPLQILSHFAICSEELAQTSWIHIGFIQPSDLLHHMLLY